MTRISVSIDSGIINSPSPETGALLAPMWVEGTVGMSASEIADFFDYRGAWIDSNFGIRSMNLTIMALNSTMPDILPVLSQLLSSPAFPEDRLEAVAQRTAAALGVRRAQVSWAAADLLNRLVYGPDHPLSRDASPELLERVSSADLHHYYRSIFTRKGMNVFVAGKLPEGLISGLTDVIESLSDTGNNPPVAVPVFQPSSTRSGHVERNDASQSSVRLGLILPGRDNPDFVPLRLLVAALGGYFGSRLMLNIREDKGYTYGINAMLLGYPEQSVMEISADCDPAYVEPLIEECLREMERMKDAGSYTPEELDRLQRITLSNLAAMLDTPFTIMDHYKASLLAGAGERYFDRQQQAVRNLSARQLADLAAKYFDISRVYISTAGK